MEVQSKNFQDSHKYSLQTKDDTKKTTPKKAITKNFEVANLGLVEGQRTISQKSRTRLSPFCSNSILVSEEDH